MLGYFTHSKELADQMSHHYTFWTLCQGFSRVNIWNAVTNSISEDLKLIIFCPVCITKASYATRVLV